MKQLKNGRGLTDSQMGFLLIVPGLAVFLAIILYPFVDAVITSFTDRSLIYPDYKFGRLRELCQGLQRPLLWQDTHHDTAVRTWQHSFTLYARHDLGHRPESGVQGAQNFCAA